MRQRVRPGFARAVDPPHGRKSLRIRSGFGLVRSYGERMGQPIAHGEVEAALAWLDPARDTQLARLAAQRMFDQGQRVSCVWTGWRLGPGTLDIDHCLPWSAWPCGLASGLPASEPAAQA
jgi:hypothetical protein